MKFAPDFESLNGIYDSAARIQLAERFLDANSADDYAKLDKEYPRLFGETAKGQSVGDVADVCMMLRKGTEIYSLIRSDGNIDISDMLACGISPVYFSATSDDDAKAEADKYSVSYLQRIEGANYGEWLAMAADKVAMRFPGYHISMRYRDGCLTDDDEQRPISEYAGMRVSCSYLLQQLVTLHLADVATVCDNDTLHPVQMAYSGISSLWLGLIERMSGGRAYRCKACDKPAVAYNERRRREYCCVACKKWAKKHPGEKRGYWYYEKR